MAPLSKKNSEADEQARNATLEILKKLGGKATFHDLKQHGCSYATLTALVDRKLVIKSGGDPVHIGPDVRWVYKLANRA